ncbi:MAG: hypothetical protein H6836_07475 [Planctomycetes bacterium]|nr:hypothetical protein [Planctomycetota bacterium]
MNVIVVSASRGAASSQLAAEGHYAGELARLGCTVRWLPVVAAPDRLPEPGPGVRLEPIVSRPPGFVAVASRVLDAIADQAVACAVAAELPDVVHILGLGGTASVNLAWMANRLGARAVVSADAHQVVCHRGDLRFAGRTECTEWREPARCAACTGIAAPGGIGPVRALLGRALAACRSPYDPRPVQGNFRNRTELVLGGVLVADLLWVGSAQDRDRLAAFGVRRERVEIDPENAALRLERLRSLVRRGDS